MQGVYLVHFETKYKHAGHYLGASQDIAWRIQKHLSNNGAALLSHLNRVGIKWNVVRVWPVDNNLYQQEKKLKAWKKSPQLCPICNPKVKLDEEMVTEATTWKP